uniref:Cation channel complex component UNC80 N-terminal domain-containing protein n=1 Tax=Timema monikensis TaxID=170555 RepID=A0A7R9E109_9NEOP|nr:unnamed protein product [Timema monikensis]
MVDMVTANTTANTVSQRHEAPLWNQLLRVEVSTGDTEVLFHLVRTTATTSAKPPCCHGCGRARESMVKISDYILSIFCQHAPGHHELKEACKSFEKVLVQNIQFGLSPSLTEAIRSIPRWRLIQASFPHVMHCAAALLHNRKDTNLQSLGASLHWIILDAAEECADADFEKDFQQTKHCENNGCTLVEELTIFVSLTLVFALLTLVKRTLNEDLQVESTVQEEIESEQPEEEEFISTIEPQLAESKNNIHGQVAGESTDLLKMLAGYIAYRVKKKKLATAYEYGHPTSHYPTKQIDWLSTISRGGLMEPTSAWAQIIFNMEEDFNTFHGGSLNKDCDVMKTLVNILKLKYIGIDEFAISCYVRTRTFIRMKSLNKKKSQKRPIYGMIKPCANQGFHGNLFVYLFAPLCHHLKESDFQNYRLENGLKMWQALWDYQHPDPACFTAHVKPKPRALWEKRLQIPPQHSGDVFMGRKGSNEDAIMSTETPPSQSGGTSLFEQQGAGPARIDHKTSGDTEESNWVSSPKDTIFPETIPEESSSTEEEHVVIFRLPSFPETDSIKEASIYTAETSVFHVAMGRNATATKSTLTIEQVTAISGSDTKQMRAKPPIQKMGSPKIIDTGSLVPKLFTTHVISSTDKESITSSKQQNEGVLKSHLSGQIMPGFIDLCAATFLDVAVLRCLFVSQWQEEGVYWALQFLYHRLREISEDTSSQQQPRRRSNSLPIPKIEVSIYQSPELKKREPKDFMEVPEVKDVSYLTGSKHIH